MRFLFGVGREGPNPSSKSSSNVTLATFAPQPLLANAGQQQHGVAATLGMAAPGMSATEAGRVFLPSGAAQQQLENWGDSVSGIVVTSPFTEASTDLDDSSDMRHRASMVGAPPVLAPPSCSLLTRRVMQFPCCPVLAGWWRRRRRRRRRAAKVGLRGFLGQKRGPKGDCRNRRHET
jgi:hypothetical protein